MRFLTQSLVGLLAAILLASCGGGGGGSNNAPFSPPGVEVTISAASSTTTPNSLVGVTVQARNPNGQPVPDGTVVTLVVSPPAVGLVSNTAGQITLGSTVQSTTAGGVATFYFHSRNLGSATLTATVGCNTCGDNQVSRSTTVTVGAGAPTDPRLSIACVSNTIPVNILNLDPFVGSPYLTECTITWRNIDGTLVGTGGSVQVSINPVNPTGGFTTLDDPSTPQIDEFLFRLGQGPVDIVAGKANIFFNSFNLPGTATITVTAIDDQTGETVSAQTVVTIVSGAPNVPASVGLFTDGFPVYVQGSGGNSSAVIQALVVDGGGALVPNPAAGVNNLVCEIIGGAQGGERLSGVNAAGAAVSGGSIAIRTVNGTGTFSYQSGSREGIVTIRCTADRADNNVDNGIQDGVIGQRGQVVSDGRLFDLKITEPLPNAAVGGGTSLLDGTYFLTVAVVATDRQGNPVIPGTEIRFGLIDFPKVPGTGEFAIRGNDGDPQESGFLFSAPSGQFTTAGGGAGPGDTLVVFGKDTVGNRDLSAARTIQSVNSATSLTVTYRFNPNDDTGQSVNNGPVIPYVIGRATKANIVQSAQTDPFGVALADMTYPATALGTTALVWAQGSGRIVNGTAKLVADHRFIRLQGEGPATLTADPSSIPANTTRTVEVCVVDAFGVGLAEIPIDFRFEDLIGNGSVNGVQTTGTLPQTTGEDGCVDAVVTTSGVVTPSQGDEDPVLVFSAIGQEAEVEIVTSGQILTASPNVFFGDGLARITLNLIDLNGNPIDDTLIIVSCESTGNSALTVNVPPGRTGDPQTIAQCNGIVGQNCPGQTTAEIGRQGFECAGTPPTGTCTFSTTTGEPEAVVEFRGEALDELASPAPPSCE